MVSGLGWRVSLVSTFPCEAVNGAELAGILPVGFSALGGGQVGIAGGKGGWKRWLINHFRPLALTMRAFMAPLLLGRYQKQFISIVNDLKPDVVHALRIPFEGMLAESTPAHIPLIVSIWGNDLTFHARTSPLMAAHTRRTLSARGWSAGRCRAGSAPGPAVGISRRLTRTRPARKWGAGPGCPEGCPGGKRASFPAA